MTLFRSAALIGARDTQTRSTKLMAKHHALARRLIDRQDDYLRFTVDPRVSFDDNAAEREIRNDQAAAEGLRVPANPDRP
jgi:transposase